MESHKKGKGAWSNKKRDERHPIMCCTERGEDKEEAAYGSRNNEGGSIER